MARVMMIGYGPLPQPGMPYVSAPALRTRHFLKPVLNAGHTVFLFTLPLPGTEGPEGEVSAMSPARYEGLSFQRFTNHSGEFALRALNEQVRQLRPEAIVGINTYPSYLAARLATALPVWADLNGYWMAETQGRFFVEQDDTRISEAWAIERAIVRRLDKFSAVSRPQLHAVLGEMAAVGRFNRHTFQYQFGHHVPNAAYRWPEPEAEAREPVLRGPVVPPDAFIILWSGGFNVWCDVVTLVECMNLLMAKYPAVHLVVTGGRIEGVVTSVYDDFERMVERSPFKDRFHRLGWVKADRLPRIYRESDLGINVDARNYETLFGARNRLNAMAAEGLAIVSTLGSEISEWLHDGRAILGAPLGDPQVMASTIEPWIEQREELAVFARNAQRIMEEDFSYERTTRPLLQWLAAPELAPDNRAKLDETQGAATDLNQVTANALDEQNLILEQFTTEQLRAALRSREALEPQRRRFLFGARRGE